MGTVGDVIFKNKVKESKKETKKDDIEVGLEVVSLEMGRILEELKNSLERISFGVGSDQKQMKNLRNQYLTSSNEVKTTKIEPFPNTETLKKYQPFKKKEDEVVEKGDEKAYVVSVYPVVRRPAPINTKQSNSHSLTHSHNKYSGCKKHLSLPKQPTYCERSPLNSDIAEISHNNLCPQYGLKKTDTDSCEKRRRKSGPNVPARQNSKISTNANFSKKGSSAKSSEIQVINASSHSSRSSTNNIWLPYHKSVLQPSTGNHTKTSVSKQVINSLEQLRRLREEVDRAVREKKTFTVCGNYYSIRRALLSRGWIEKIRIMHNTHDRDTLKILTGRSLPELLENVSDPQNGYMYKRVIMSKLLGRHQVDFYWDTQLDCFNVCPEKVKQTLINRFKRGIFGYTSKRGLCESLKQAHWYQIPGIAHIRHPRAYNLANAESTKDFTYDFKLTAAMSLLKWTVNTGKDTNPYDQNKLISKAGKVPLKIFEFAVVEICKAIQKYKHEDVDYEFEDAQDYHWNDFLNGFYRIVHLGHHFKTDNKTTPENLIHCAKSKLEEIGKFWPHLDMDGVMNIWILKPSNGSRGIGIYLCRTLEYVLKVIKTNPHRNYIIQKYIERPFLVRNTKFDIRQWFLISSAVPLTIWIYKDCYVRFSSQPFDLRKLHESIHLTNNSIQVKYSSNARNRMLPVYNMWDSNQFKRYLAKIGKPDIYDDVIYPGMKQCLTAAILIHQNNIDTRKNSFELYGSDFMITEDFKPWLLEINSRPALYPSTPVTARLCPQMLDDLVKVIIDHSKDSKAKTGKFELVYKEKTHTLPQIFEDDFKLQGTPLTPTYLDASKKQNKITEVINTGQSNTVVHPPQKKTSKEMKNTLENLLGFIQQSKCEVNGKYEGTHKKDEQCSTIKASV